MTGIGYLKRDESRHIGYGTFLLQRLICEHPGLYERIVQRMQELAPLAVRLNEEGTQTDVGNPYAIPLDAVMQFSMKQLQKRMDVLKRALGKSVDEIYRLPEAVVGVD
ncbi:hypothetical protein [Alicyclobacillus contaminans]|uniref:hypothetical protein n=1 Tax=Alicyclobacillus contaminans TaxID=392016 RepID=UPI000405F981